MKFTARMTNLGIELAFHTGDGPEPLQPSADANQENPRKSYVYAHLDMAGKVFYVGKGSGRRAWAKDRDALWHRYVDKHLGGQYQVFILHDNLSPINAEELEAEWIAQFSNDILNWINAGRALDYQALGRFHELRDANRALIRQAREIEKYDLNKAASLYTQALEAIREYAFIDYETGLVGKLLLEQLEELGRTGEIEALERLSLCLVKLNRAHEAAQHATDYFAIYKFDMCRPAYQRISRRIEKALNRNSR